LGTVAGVDDAGRGCVIGPLVVAGVLVEEGKVEDLRRLGVRDSKRLLPRKRETLVKEIERRADCTYFEIPPWAIDHVVERNRRLRKLNYLEAMAMAKVIRDLQPDKVYVDASDVFPERFSQQISRVLRGGATVISEHQADNKYAVVSAASIIAKVIRDRIMLRYHRRYPEYRFDRHKGYGTREHMRIILKAGPSPLHRRSFYPVGKAAS